MAKKRRNITSVLLGVSVVNRIRYIAFALLFLLPIGARAAVVAPATIADGTYTVKVVRVVDATHVDVMFDNDNESTLVAGRPSVNFSKLQANDQLKLSLIGGNVMVYVDLTTH
jgi:hypothetical protein